MGKAKGQQVRDDVSQIINSGAIPGTDNPRELYRIRPKGHPKVLPPSRSASRGKLSALHLGLILAGLSLKV